MMEAQTRKCKRLGKHTKASSNINNLDDGCLMHIFSFLSPIPDRYNTALVCHRWLFLACHPRHWLRVDRSVKDLSKPGVFPSIETAVAAARPGDTILIASGGSHVASNIQINKPLCLIGYNGYVVDVINMVVSRAPSQGLLTWIHNVKKDGRNSRFFRLLEISEIGAGELPEDTTLVCSRGSDSAMEFSSTCKLANLTVRVELGCCLLHRSGRLTIDGCILQCESNPLDHLSYAIVSTASSSEYEVLPSALKTSGDSVAVSRTRIEGGAKAVLTSGALSLQQVRVIYSRTSVFFWFDVEQPR